MSLMSKRAESLMQWAALVREKAKLPEGWVIPEHGIVYWPDDCIAIQAQYWYVHYPQMTQKPEKHLVTAKVVTTYDTLMGEPEMSANVAALQITAAARDAINSAFAMAEIMQKAAYEYDMEPEDVDDPAES